MGVLSVFVPVLAFSPAAVLVQATEPPAATPAQAPATKTDKATDETPVIVVTARKSSVTNKIDRRVYDVSARPDAAFSSATDVLARIPSVTVDPRGRIALRGNSQVKVLVDGVEARPGVLNNLQASDIDHIEVMTNPSAQFSSDGSGGIINLVLKKKRKDGLSGIWSVRGDGDGRYSANANVSYKTGRWTTNASVGVNRERTMTRTDGRQQWETASGPETTTGTGLSTTSPRSSYESASVAYDLTPKDRLQLSGNHYRSRALSKDAGTVLITGLSGVLDDHTESTVNPDSGEGGEITAHYTHTGAIKDEHFDLDVTYGSSQSKESSAHRLSHTVPSQAEQAYIYLNSGSDSSVTIKGDYERPFGNSRLTAGFQAEQNDSDARSRSENIAAIVPGEADIDTAFPYSRQTLAGYVTWQTPLGRWVVMPGLRIEADAWDAGTVKRNDLRFLPSLNMNRDLSDTTKLVASYSHRTQRPDVFQLNPRRIYWSRLYAYEGNPNLVSQDTDSYEIGYEFADKGFSSNGSLYYRVNKNPQTDTRRITADQVVIQSVVNADQSRAAGLELTAKGNLIKKLDYSLNFNLFDSEVAGMVGGETLRRQNVTYSGNAVIDYKPRPKDWIQLTLSGEGRGVALQGYKTGYYRLDMTYRHKLTPKWTASVRAFDLLNSSKQTDIFVTPEGDSRTVSRKERPAIMIGIARSFGNTGQ
ncbi:TonB-dependent receptor [Asticcacaulis sp. AC466]|uniref:TonB-dependent receptor n=1 Tax=Asticcacaulis sp. AC466 TaxID=1282362 RepID=UPI000425DB08|nr:TonB-dependent receptor [Asticcacaulis sp. AC466]